MTPVLAGRWESRLFLALTVGLLVTLLFGVIFNDWRTVLAILALSVVIGSSLDLFYAVVQRFRWDSDWPPVFVFLSGVLEGIVLWFLIQRIDSLAFVTFNQFLAHYSSVWLASFCMLFGGMRIIFPRWRFNGGMIGLGTIPLLSLIAIALLVFGLPLVLT